MTLAVVAAVARDGAIGRDNALPWRLPEDLKRFRALTEGHPVIMGRHTWDSLPERFRPLPQRRNIVVTRQAGWAATGARPAHGFDEALALARAAGSDVDSARVFVIGGAKLYAQALPHADELYLTEVARDYPDANAWFPAWRREDFAEIARESHRAAPPDGLDFDFVTLRRRAG